MSLSQRKVFSKGKSLALIVLLGGLLLWGLSEVTDAESTYSGREADALWRRGAQERIERYRKGNIEVTVLKPSGQPLPQANLTFAMRRHAFRFGTAVRAERLLDDSQEQYRAAFLENFNSATLPKFYDFHWEKKSVAEQSRKVATEALDWLLAHHIALHGHVLVWNLGPGGRRSAQPLEPQASRERVSTHLAKTIGDPAFSSRIDRWDVLNEPAQNSEIFDLLGRQEAAHWFAEAHRYAPQARLILNEAGLCSGTERSQWAKTLHKTEELVRFLHGSGSPVHGLGLQSHHTGDLSPIPKVISTLERLSELDVELLITEYDMRLTPSAGHLKSWQERWRSPLPGPVSAEMEQLEADYLRDYLTACFSQPKVTGFTMWGFWDGDHWLYNAPLYRKDWSLKPAGRVWQQLTRETWWTEAQVRTDEFGRAEIRGFLGEYDLTVEHGTSQETFSFETLDWETPTSLTVTLGQRPVEKPSRL